MKQIYTGYKWRKMTPEEIEIMDATRLRPFKLEEPEAGDIYDQASFTERMGRKILRIPRWRHSYLKT